MMKIEIKTIRHGEGRATIEVIADGHRIMQGGVGGEPEDNTIDRDYDWISGAIAAAVKACGGRVVETDEQEPE